MTWTILAFTVLLSFTGCSRPAPIPIQRLASPTGALELTLWHEEAAGTLDSSMLLTINKPGARFSSENIRAGLKRGRGVEGYWTAVGEAVLSFRELYGWLISDSRTPAIVVCGLSQSDCEAALPPAQLGRKIGLSTYHSGESEPFEGS